MYVFAAVAVAVAVIHAAYRTVETRWPDNYMVLAAGPDYEVSRHLHTYALFRLGPVAVVCAFAGSVLADESEPVILPAAAIVILYWVLTSGRALFSLVRSNSQGNRPLISFVHLIILLPLVGTALGAAVVGTKLGRAIPSPGEVVAGLWTGLLAAVLAVFVLRVTSASDGSEHEAIFRDSRDEIDPRLWDYASERSVERGLDPILTQAVLLVENIQRPKWFRRLESAAGRVFRSGSYGIMQARARRPLTDEESIDVALAGVLSGQQGIGEGGYRDHDQILSIARSYNPSDQYAESVANAYMWLENGSDDYGETYRAQEEQKARILSLYTQRLADTHVRLSADDVRMLASICRADGIFRATDPGVDVDLFVSVEFVKDSHGYGMSNNQSATHQYSMLTQRPAATASAIVYSLQALEGLGVDLRSYLLQSRYGVDTGVTLVKADAVGLLAPEGLALPDLNPPGSIDGP